jgi:hypothetical protein
MQIGQEIAHLLVVENIAKTRHHVATLGGGGANTIVIRGRSAGKIRLLIQTLKPWAMKRVFTVGVVALRALLLIDGIPAHLRGSEFAQGLRWRKAMASRQHQSANQARDSDSVKAVHFSSPNESNDRGDSL